jgi:hypothetical protein
LLVRLIILAIIWTEFAGRFGWLPYAASWHALLATMLIAAAPFTYLSHAPLAPLAIWGAVQRRRRHAFA